MDTIIRHRELPTETSAPSYAWRKVLYLVALGRVGVGGAGLAMALIGALNLLSLLLDHKWISSINDDLLLLIVSVGALIGVVTAAAVWRIYDRQQKIYKQDQEQKSNDSLHSLTD